jgi:hypothetical protein
MPKGKKSKKKGKKKTKLRKKDVMIYIDRDLYDFAKIKLPELNLSKIASEAIINAVGVVLEVLVIKDPERYQSLRFDFYKYLIKRKRVMAENGDDTEMASFYDELDKKLEKYGLRSITLF